MILLKILVDIGHPAHVHLFKNFIWLLEKKGHTICITARDKEITLLLLDRYNFKYSIISRFKKGIVHIGKEMIFKDFNLLKIIKSQKPDIMLAVLDPSITHVGCLLKIPTVTLTDTEHAKLAKIMTFPFTDVILTPSSYAEHLGKKQVFYNGYHELAYLHPNHFIPNPDVLTEMGFTQDDPFIIVRFVSWQASHDVGHHGIKDKIRFVKELENYGRVLITSEGTLPEELQPYQIRISPEKLHDMLYYASLYVGEGATMATEAALLGTPAIYISSLAGTMGNFIELEKKYDLMYSFSDSDTALQKALDILRNPESKGKWAVKRERIVRDKIDVTTFLMQFIENYPQSFTEYKDHRDSSQ